jgi:hypothetical protein
VLVAFNTEFCRFGGRPPYARCLNSASSATLAGDDCDSFNTVLVVGQRIRGCMFNAHTLFVKYLCVDARNSSYK